MTKAQKILFLVTFLLIQYQLFMLNISASNKWKLATSFIECTSTEPCLTVHQHGKGFAISIIRDPQPGDKPVEVTK